MNQLTIEDFTLILAGLKAWQSEAKPSTQKEIEAVLLKLTKLINNPIDAQLEAEKEANYWATPSDQYSFNDRQVWQMLQKAFLHGLNRE
jgi:hypothetical protein